MDYNNETLNKIANLDQKYLDQGLIDYLKKGKKIYIKPENRGNSQKQRKELERLRKNYHIAKIH